jgi:hypothetical protein
MELSNMGIYVDIEKNVILKGIRDSGRAEGIEIGREQGVATD